MFKWPWFGPKPESCITYAFISRNVCLLFIFEKFLIYFSRTKETRNVYYTPMVDSNFTGGFRTVREKVKKNTHTNYERFGCTRII